jgi:hypothetical protein
MRNSFITEFGKEKYVTYININKEYFEVDIQVYRRPIGFWQWFAWFFWEASYGEMLDEDLFGKEDFDAPMPTAQQIIDKAKCYTNNAISRYYAKHIRENKLKNLKKDIDKLLTM